MDLCKIYSDSVDAREHWREVSYRCREWDYIDFRASVRGVAIAQEMFARKVRNAGDTYLWNVCFPWTSGEVARLVFGLPAEQCFDRPSLKSKIILRRIIKARLGLDSDAFPKMSYGFDYERMLTLLGADVINEIRQCAYFRATQVDELIVRLWRSMKGSGRSGQIASSLMHRLFMLAGWLNRNKYTN